MVHQLPLVELIWQDETGSTASWSIRLKSGSTVAEAEAIVATMASLLAAINGCTLIKARIRYKAQSETRGIPSSDSFLKRCGVFIFENSDGTSQNLVSVFGIADDLLVASGPGADVLIDSTNADVASFVNELVDVGFVNPFDIACDNLIIAYRQSRV